MATASIQRLNFSPMPLLKHRPMPSYKFVGAGNSYAGQQCKLACGRSQLCAGLEAGIEGVVHDLRERIEAKACSLTADGGTEAGIEVEEWERRQ